MAIIFPAAQINMQVTGYSAVTPCLPVDLYTADISAVNGRQLYTGTATGSPFSISLGTQTIGLVTTQPWVADSHGVQLKITCTPRAGASLVLVGKDRSGQVLTEIIDVSSGSAISVKKYFTLDTNGITFTGLSNGDTITIKQDRWGVVSKIQQTYPYCANTKYWMFEGGLNIGDYSSAPGYFSSMNDLMFFAGAHGINIGSNPQSYLYIGSLSNGLPSEGSIIISDRNGANGSVINAGTDSSGMRGIVTIYDACMKNMNRSLAYGGCFSGNYSNPSTLKGIHANGGIIDSGILIADDICIYRPINNGVCSGSNSVISNARVHNSVSGYSMGGSGLSDFITGVVLGGIHFIEFMLAYSGASPTTARLNDCVHADNKIQANGPSNIYRTTYVDILVNDKDGNPINGALCTIKDMDGNVVSYNPEVTAGIFSLLASDTALIHPLISWLTLGFAIGDIIVQDAEFMLITGIGGTGNKTATVTRGYYSKYPACYHYSKPIYKGGAVPTNANGVMATQCIPLKRYIRNAGGVGAASLTTTFKDHTIIITKQGYTTYQDVVTFAENDLTGQDLEIALQPKAYIDNYIKQNIARLG